MNYWQPVVTLITDTRQLKQTLTCAVDTTTQQDTRHYVMDVHVHVADISLSSSPLHTHICDLPVLPVLPAEVQEGVTDLHVHQPLPSVRRHRPPVQLHLPSPELHEAAWLPPPVARATEECHFGLVGCRLLATGHSA